MSADSGVSLQVLLPMMNAFPGLGLDQAKFLERLQVDQSAMQDPQQHRVSRPLLTNLLEEMALEAGQPNLGLALAAAIPFGTFQAFDFYLASSPNLRVAAERACQLYQMFTTDLSVTLEIGDPYAQVVWRYHTDLPRIRHIVEFAVGITVIRACHIAGPEFVVRGVHFTHPEPPDTTLHRKVFGAPVLFGQPLDKYFFDSASLERPCIAADARMQNVLEPLVSEMERASVPADPFLTRVRSSITTYLDRGEQGIVETAAALNLNRRALQRKLAEQGTTYRDLLDEIRRTKALAMLSEGTAAADVAAAVGFQGADALYRAYRRWTGESFKKTGR